MNYDIRRICVYFPEVHSRYFVDTNGVVYTSLGKNTKYKVVIDGKRVSLNGFVKQHLPNMDESHNALIRYKDSKYFIMYDGTLLQRLATRLRSDRRVDVCLIRTHGHDRGNRYEIQKLLAGVFIKNIKGLEVHHIDGNPTNNALSNLAVLSYEEHRGKNGIHHCSNNSVSTIPSSGSRAAIGTQLETELVTQIA